MHEENFIVRLKEEFEIHVFKQGFQRIETCLNMLNHKEVWHKPNKATNSVGHLILHLCGNVRQWIGTTFDDREDVRDRTLEFSTKIQLSKTDLWAALEQVKVEMTPIIERLDVTQLAKLYKVQSFEVDGISILVHVIEHFSYHVGQITWITKWIKEQETGYYSDEIL